MQRRMDAAGAVDAQNAPTAPWKTAQNAVSHSYHRPFFLFTTCYPCSRLTLLPMFPVAPSLKAPTFERSDVILGQAEPFATLPPVSKSSMPVRLDALGIVRLDNVNGVRLLGKLN